MDPADISWLSLIMLYLKSRRELINNDDLFFEDGAVGPSGIILKVRRRSPEETVSSTIVWNRKVYNPPRLRLVRLQVTWFLPNPYGPRSPKHAHTPPDPLPPPSIHPSD